MDTRKPRIGFVCGLSTFVNGVPYVGAALKYIKLWQLLSDEIVWIGASNLQIDSKLLDNVITMGIRWSDVHEKPLLIQVLYHLSQQIKITLKLFKLRKVDILIFARGLDFYILPILFVRIFLHNKVIIKSDGRSSVAAMMYLGKGKRYKVAVIKIIEWMSYFLANKIVVDSTYAIKLYNMQKYGDKICVASSDCFVDTHFFTNYKELSDREYDVAYVGRFSRKKGFLEFMQAVQLLPRSEQNKVIIIGAEPVDYEVQKLLTDIKTQNKARVVDWAEPDELVRYLNDIKVVVIPSYGEGMTSTALEAIACGCMVIATPVGSLPAIIKDESTGFILKNNSPTEIVAGIIRALSYPRLDSIAQNARLLIDEEYTYEAMSDKWRNILKCL